MADEISQPGDPVHTPAGEAPDREAQPVDAEQPPRLPFPVVGIGASAGGLEATGELLEAMRPDCGMAFVLVQHLPPDHESLLAEILGRRTTMPVLQVEDGMAVEVNHVYVIRPGHVLTIHDGRLHLGPRLGTPRAANRPVDDFFKSLAEEQRERAICVILSGMGSNGTAGAQAVKAVGGLCLAQDPETAQFPSMPRHLIDAGYADHVARPRDMPEVLLGYAHHPYATGGREADADAALRREREHLREIMAILRTRTRHDYSGYKKPTVLRRVQRRMGLNRSPSVGDYARLLRHSPAEAVALADDLLIHVTGFFRDPDAWTALQKQVIAPLVAAREAGGTVRAWVTACSSGEEAYTLAMLLTEEVERAGKPLDIKVFATDLAERTLGYARAGIYPGGIESEITPERLDRFFTRDAEVYRVRPELRDRVVFASQNVLQDPPFSRLDIATCRNLLIYLEPEVQNRVLALLHFGLREGGALFLGTAETISGVEDLFEQVDKKARIFRRVGPVRHAGVDFPLPHAVGGLADGIRGARGFALRPAAPRPAGPRPPLEARTHQALLADHTPAAVTTDRDGRILYYHGDTRPFLEQLSGEPTRDLMVLARDGVRGAARVALHRAAAQNARAASFDGWVDLADGRRVRVVVTASPLAPEGGGDGPADCFVVSFAERGEVVAVPEADADADGETGRLRAELRSTIEELQTSNEELKASNEEVMSINEELQSANEELETSKEEMQSLNEELTTVNSQLRAKVDDYQAASSDLASLLASTDIAVLFLDPTFRIRRYTPAVRDLLDLIAADVGRPLSALARKFDDPDLDADARAVLDRLVSIEREVAAAGGRHYLRRVLPYRTVDNRIDGVVVTFVDITRRVRAEEGLRASEDRLRMALDAARMGIWTWNPAADVHTRDATLNRLLGLDVGETVRPLADFIARVHADDRVQVAAAFDATVRDGRPLTAEFRVVWPDGSVRWLRDQGGKVGADGSGVLTGAVVDVTDRRAAEERLRLVLASATDYAIFTMAPDRTVTSWSPGAEAVMGWTEQEMVGRPADEMFTPEDRAAGAPQQETDTARRDGRAADERWHLRKDGSRFYASGVLTRLGDSGAGGFAKVLRDLTDRKRAEDALARDARILASVHDAVVVTDLGGVITYWNAGAERLFGWTADEMVGQHYADRYPEPDRSWVAAEFVKRVAGEPWVGEFEDRRKDGSQVWIDARVSRFDGPDGRPAGILGVSRDVTDRKRAEDDLRAARDELEARVAERTTEVAAALDSLEGEMERRSELARRLATAQEDERRRVSRDLHDSVGQLLTGLSLAAKSAQAAGPLTPVAVARLEDVLRLSDAVGKELHALAVRLRPTALDDLGLGAAIGELVAEWSARTGLPVDYQATGLDGGGRLPAEVETTLYRVVQEALTNAAKHAGATQVGVVLTRQPAEATAVVEDDGAGFDPDAAGAGRLGLVGMRERLALVGGTLEVESAPGAGTTVIARLPLGAADRGPPAARA